MKHPRCPTDTDNIASYWLARGTDRKKKARDRMLRHRRRCKVCIEARPWMPRRKRN